MDFPSFSQRPLTPEGSEPLLWIGAAMLVSLPGAPELLSPAPSMQPLGPGAKGPWAIAPTLRVLSGFLSPPGSHWHPLGSVPMPRRVPRGLTAWGPRFSHPLL